MMEQVIIKLLFIEIKINRANRSKPRTRTRSICITVSCIKREKYYGWTSSLSISSRDSNNGWTTAFSRRVHNCLFITTNYEWTWKRNIWSCFQSNLEWQRGFLFYLLFSILLFFHFIIYLFSYHLLKILYSNLFCLFCWFILSYFVYWITEQFFFKYD